VEPVFYPEEMVLGIPVDGPDVFMGIIKRLFIIVRLYQFSVFIE